MFLESFEQLDSKPQFKKKQIKKQYPAGFRNYHPLKIKIEDEISTSNESDIFQKLKIGNLKQLYMQTIPKVDNTKIAIAQQKQSIQRLIKMPEKQQQIQIDTEQDEQRRKENIQLFNKTYHKVQGYCQKSEKILFQNEYKKIKEKLIQSSSKISKIAFFTDLVIKFVLNYVDKYTKKSKIENDQLCIDFANFVNAQRRQQKQAEKSIRSEQLSDLTSKNIFFFGFFDVQQIKKQTYQFNSLLQIVRTNTQYKLKIQQVRHFINKKITIPFESSTVQPHRQTKAAEIKSNQQLFQKFHAKPLPKTTYQKPKERPKSQMTKTQQQPFNLTNTNINVAKMQDYYKWQRQFHAKEVPETTYKPIKIEAGNQDQKRKRALQLLHSSKYPENMNYLKNYNEYNQKKQIQLSRKYTMQRTQLQQRSIPNFAEIHRKQIQNMEYTKVENRKLTKTQPFNLSLPRPPKPQREAFVPQYTEKQFHMSKKEQIEEQKIKLQPKSTIKYDSYVNHLKKQKEAKIQQQENKKKEEKKKQKPQYKQILKGRLQDEIKGKSKNFSPQKLKDNIVKVDLQKIYQYEPLLIERETIKSKKQTQSHTKNWQPII